MMGWLAVVILVFGTLFLIDPATLQKGWQVGVAGLLVGGLAGVLVGEALGYRLAQREQARGRGREARVKARVRDGGSTVAVNAPDPAADLEPPPDPPCPPAERTP